MPKEEEELRASDLLPPDDPPADDAPKRIAERRVVGWFMADRLVKRVEWRPVGNSKHFWSKMEEDDPFLPRPVIRRVRQDHTLYPADRIDRIPSSSVPQQPRPKTQAPPRPRQEAPKPKREAPKPSVNRDPRVAPTPSTPQTPTPADAPPAKPIDRTPPKPKPPGKKRSGRIRISGATQRPSGGTGMVRGPSAAEIRARKAAEREEAVAPKEAPPPPKRSLDDVLGILGQLKQQQELHEKGLLTEDSSPEVTERGAPTPKPKRVAQPTPRPAPTPTPKAEAPVDRTPPKPEAPKKAAPKPPGPPGGGSLNDLFGGPSEGRVKIGKRTKPKSVTTESDSED